MDNFSDMKRERNRRGDGTLGRFESRKDSQAAQALIDVEKATDASKSLSNGALDRVGVGFVPEQSTRARRDVGKVEEMGNGFVVSGPDVMRALERSDSKQMESGQREEAEPKEMLRLFFLEPFCLCESGFLFKSGTAIDELGDDLGVVHAFR